MTTRRCTCARYLGRQKNKIPHDEVGKYQRQASVFPWGVFKFRKARSCSGGTWCFGALLVLCEHGRRPPGPTRCLLACSLLRQGKVSRRRFTVRKDDLQYCQASSWIELRAGLEQVLRSPATPGPHPVLCRPLKGTRKTSFTKVGAKGLNIMVYAPRSLCCGGQWPAIGTNPLPSCLLSAAAREGFVEALRSVQCCLSMTQR